MSIETGSVLIIDINGLVMAVAPGSAIPANTTAFLMAGTDGTNARTLSTDSSGRPVFVGAGVAGTPAGGVISIQGVSGGQGNVYRRQRRNESRRLKDEAGLDGRSGSGPLPGRCAFSELTVAYWCERHWFCFPEWNVERHGDAGDGC
jgi:hypothetical protein